MLEEKDFQKIRSVVRDVVKSELKPVKSDLAAIRRETKAMVSFFDKEYLDLRSRIERIEEILNLKSLKNSTN